MHVEFGPGGGGLGRWGSGLIGLLGLKVQISACMATFASCRHGMDFIARGLELNKV